MKAVHHRRTSQSWLGNRHVQVDVWIPQRGLRCVPIHFDAFAVTDHSADSPYVCAATQDVCTYAGGAWGCVNPFSTIWLSCVNQGAISDKGFLSWYAGRPREQRDTDCSEARLLPHTVRHCHCYSMMGAKEA